MAKVIDYVILHSVRGTVTLDESVRVLLERGWKPHGAPVYANSAWHQAMIKEDNGKTAMEEKA